MMSRIIWLFRNVFVLLLLHGCVYDTHNLGSDYVYDDEHKMIYSSSHSGNEIPSTILEYRFDRSFIIIKQKPRENDPNASLYSREFHYSKGFDEVYYWIIIKEKNVLLGPMIKDEYILAKQKYAVEMDF